MRIEKIELSGFRGFTQKEQSFDQNFNVIIGINGIGKTSILEAITILLTRILPRTTPAIWGHRRFLAEDVRVGSSVLAARIWLTFDNIPLDFSLSESFGEQKTFTEDRSRARFRPVSERYQAKNETSKIGTPVALFYTTDRAAFRFSRKAFKPTPTGRAAAYHNALRGKFIDYRSLITWLQTKHALARERPEDARLLDVVHEAIRKFLPAFGQLEGSDNPPRLYLKKDNLKLSVEQLSDGERSILAMVIDIVRHLVHANPAATNPMVEGEGVVLIDELELHLHPKWQRTVVEYLQEVFPKLQFIATTHSPFVIQSLKPGQLIDLDPESFVGEYSGKSIEDITEAIMGIQMPQKSDRYQKMITTAERYFHLLQDARPQSREQVAALRQDLDALTEPFSDDPAYIALLRVERETKLGGLFDATS